MLVEAELRIGGQEVVKGECLAAFWDGSSVQAFLACSDPERLAEMLVRLASGVNAAMVLGGVPKGRRDRLLAAVAAALAGPPDALPLEEEGGANPGMAVEVAGDRAEGRVGIAAVARPEEQVITTLFRGPGAAMVALLRQLAAVLSFGFEQATPSPADSRAGLLRELCNAVLNPRAFLEPAQLEKEGK